MLKENRILASVEREEVRNAIAAYCMALDEGDMDSVADCFALDALADYGPGRGGVQTGSRAIVERIAQGQAVFRRTHHQLGQIHVTLHGDEAQAMSYVTAWHERYTGEREIACLRYIDGLRQVDSRWMIHSRRVEAAYVDGFSGTQWDWVKRKRTGT
jgi:ketosteroid isomerase-like protein